MTSTERTAALEHKSLWDSIEDNWQGFNVDFVTKAVLAGRTNEYIYGQLEFPPDKNPKDCEQFKQACYRAFDYVRAKNWEAVL